MFEIDHLVIACADLAQARVDWEARFGLPLTEEGKHDHFGTHNHLLSLGPECYLELIAIDPDAPKPASARWFGLDDFHGESRLTHWAVRCADMDLAKPHLPGGPWRHRSLTRGAYEWDIAIGAAGPQPLDDMAPIVLRWKSERPTVALPDHGARLVRLDLSHPTPQAFAQVHDPKLTVHAGTPSLSALIRTPHSDISL